MGFGGLGMWEIMLIFLIILLVFGAKRLPEIGSSLGKGIREFKGSIREIERELKVPDLPPAPKTTTADAQPALDDEAQAEEDGEPRRLTPSS